MQFDIRVAELICSRLCHDLVSPIGAINNGIELIEEMDGGMADEAMALVGQSGRRAAALLRCFRLAYGAAGAQGAIGLADTRDVAQAYLVGTKVSLDWPQIPAGATDPLPAGTGKLVLNLIVLASEALIYGGKVSVMVEGGAAPRQVTIRADGRTAALGEEERRALTGATPTDALTPKTVHAYATGVFARHYRMAVDPGAATGTGGSLVLRLDLPA